MALVQSVTLPLQAIIGGLFVVFFGIFGMKLFPTFGFLVPLGFTEGPGQALSIGKVWEGVGFEHGATLGLTFAAIGFLFAFFVGVPLVNWGIRKGYAKHGSESLPQDLLIGIIPKNQQKEPAGELTTHSGNIDTLAFQAALIGLVYVLTYGFIIQFGKFLPPDAASILWGFFFFFGMLIALILRILMGKLGVDHLIDPGVQRRITGWAVDFLIVSTVMAIQLVVVKTYILPISVIALVTGILTTVVVVYLGRRIDSYNLERTVAIYGTVTGTVPSGLLLLRIVDPEFRSPVTMDIALMNVVVSPVIAGLMVLVNAPVWWDWSIGLTVLVFAGVMSLALIMMRVLKLWGEPKF
jgi:ESS family glutamate:Na+ symporter